MGRVAGAIVKPFIPGPPSFPAGPQIVYESAPNPAYSPQAGPEGLPKTSIVGNIAEKDLLIYGGAALALILILSRR